MTLSRIVLAGFFSYFLLQNGICAKITALVIFLLAAFTDYLDGYFAKRLGLVNDFGKFMDPVADKVLILTAFFMFTQIGFMAGWMFAIIAFREIFITVLRLRVMLKGKVLAAEAAGKIKTVAQMAAVCAILSFMIAGEAGSSWIHVLALFSNWLIILAFILTVYSGASYLWNNRKEIYVQ